MKMRKTSQDALPQLYIDMIDRCGSHSSDLISGLHQGSLNKIETAARALLGQIKALVDLIDMRKKEDRP